MANKDTLFLDELGEIGPNLQAKLLRAIEGGGFTLVGGLKDVTVKRLEKLYLTRVLEDNDWQQSKVSALLGVDPKTLYRKIKQYHLKPS